MKCVLLNVCHLCAPSVSDTELPSVPGTKRPSYTDYGEHRRWQVSANTTVKIHLQSALQIYIGTKCEVKKCVHPAPLGANIKQLTTESSLTDYQPFY